MPQHDSTEDEIAWKAYEIIAFVTVQNWRKAAEEQRIDFNLREERGFVCDKG